MLYIQDLNIMIAHKVTMLLCVLVAKGGIVPGPCNSVNKFVDSWTGHVKGKLEIPISEDISDYTITFRTDKQLSNIQACIQCSVFLFLF